jgi:hypothetical protein
MLMGKSDQSCAGNEEEPTHHVVRANPSEKFSWIVRHRATQPRRDPSDLRSRRREVIGRDADYV